MFSDAKLIGAELTLDDNVPECMGGILRIGGAEFSFEGIKGTFTYGDIRKATEEENLLEIGIYDLVNNDEFHDEIALLEDVSSRLKISKDFIEIV